MTHTTYFPHKKFLTENNIDIDTLPKALKKRVIGFQDLEEHLKMTVDEDHESLEAKMEQISHELDEDLEEHFEADLHNNDLLEEPEHETKPAHECGCKKNTAHHPGPPPALVDQPVQVHTGDEQIIEDLYRAHVRIVRPVQLINRGFKTTFHSRKIIIGQYLLKRKRFSTDYEIFKLHK